MKKCRRLEQPEVHFNGRDHGHRLAVLHARLETPLLHGFDRFLIEAEAQRPHYLHLFGHTLLVHYDLQLHGALPFGLARFFGILRLYFEGDYWRGKSAPDPISPASESTSGTWANAGAPAYSDSASDTASNAAAQPAAIRRNSKIAQR